ncbi:hypothetical protein KAJ27_07245 [bacterium]|nr:hypothetical protein [bacterium]
MKNYSILIIFLLSLVIIGCESNSAFVDSDLWTGISHAVIISIEPSETSLTTEENMTIDVRIKNSQGSPLNGHVDIEYSLAKDNNMSGEAVNGLVRFYYTGEADSGTERISVFVLGTHETANIVIKEE